MWWILSSEKDVSLSFEEDLGGLERRLEAISLQFSARGTPYTGVLCLNRRCNVI